MKKLPHWVQFWVDVLFASLFIIVLLWIIMNVSQLGIFGLFDPIGDAFADLETSDIAMSWVRDDETIKMVNEDITLVNIGDLSRAEIARQIDTINKYNPKILAIDCFFPYLKPDTLGDLLLADALSRTENLVMVSKLIHKQGRPEDAPLDSIHTSHPIFTYNAQLAYANLDTEAESQEDYKACRVFPPQMQVNGERHLAFGVKVAHMFDSAATNDFLIRENEEEIINYKGNMLNPFANSKIKGAFFVLDAQQVLQSDFVPQVFEDKIVMLGFMGSNFMDPSWEDKFYTPMNKKYVGRANPDMYGVVIHANIIAMILNRDWVKKIAPWQSNLISILLMLMNVALFSLIYKRLPRWYDGITKLTQLVEILLIVALMIYIFSFYSIKINLTLGLAAIALAGDSLEVYYGVIKNLFSAKQRKLLFRVNRSDEID